MGVDIDRKLLVDHCRRLDPLICDFLFRRCRPLHIDLFHGSLLDYDHRLNGIDAITLIEVYVNHAVVVLIYYHVSDSFHRAVCNLEGHSHEKMHFFWSDSTENNR